MGIVQIALKRSFLEPFCCWKCGQFDGNSLYLEGLQQQADHVQAARVVELQQLWASTARGLRVRPVRALGWRGGWPSGGASLAPAPAAAPGAVALAVALALAEKQRVAGGAHARRLEGEGGGRDPVDGVGVDGAHGLADVLQPLREDVQRAHGAPLG